MIASRSRRRLDRALHRDSWNDLNTRNNEGSRRAVLIKSLARLLEMACGGTDRTRRCSPRYRYLQNGPGYKIQSWGERNPT